MSRNLLSVVSLLGGLLAGLATAGALLWRQQQALHVARRQARTDEVTGLPNRRALFTHLRAVVHGGQPVAVVLLDLDQFKTVNDTYGHATGDDLLREVADRLRHLPAPVRLAARLSGDEFALLVTGDAAAGYTAAMRAWHTVTAPIPIGGQWLDVGVSIGVAASTLGGDERRLLHHADLAMYQAKAAGGGVRTHTPRPGAEVPERPAVRCRDRRRQ